MEPKAGPARAVQFKLEFEHCPVEASLGVLGRKWALLVLRDIALFRAQRFNEMLRTTPGLTKRVLSLRLRELEREGFIVRGEQRAKFTRWEVTPKGRDVLPVLMTLVQFGSKWHAERVFSDARPRALHEIFDERYIERVLGRPRGALRRRVPKEGSARGLPTVAPAPVPVVT
jgi:DNA-binding HxlR family transcriptional regulator